MPLAELDVNLPRNGPQMSQRQGGKQPLPKPISSMLRTSTETGDISPFARPRPPRSSSRLSARSASTSVNGNGFLPRPPQRPHESRRFRPPLSRQDTGRSSLRSYHSNARQRYRPPPPNRYGLDPRPSPTSASGFYGHASLHNLRTRSGYRPTSPALSDAQSLPNYDQYAMRCRAPSRGTAASSSASVFNQDPTSREFNNSTPSLRRFPSPAMPSAYQRYGWSPGPARRPTPVPPPLWSAVQPVDDREQGLEVSRPPTASSGAFYYDYTEAFTEDFNPLDQSEHISPLFSAEHAIPEQGPPPRQAQTPFGALAGSAFKPSEMATKYNRRESEKTEQTEEAIELAAETDSNEMIPPKETHLALEPAVAPIQTRQSTSSNRPAFHPVLRSFKHLADRASRATLSQATSQVNATGSITAKATTKTTPKSAAKSVSEDWQLPSLKFKPLSFLRSEDERPHSSQHSRLSRPSIISPTPKRPVSSQSRRRFSKILEVENAYQFDGKPLDLARSYDSLNSLKHRCVMNSDTGYPQKYSIPPFLPRHSVIMEPSRETSSNADIHETKPGSRCDKSTVESLLDKHIECLGLQIESPPESTLDALETSTMKTDCPDFDPSISQQPSSSSGTGLKAAESAPCLTQISSPQSRPSYGWNTLNSVSNLSAIGLIQSPGQIDAQAEKATRPVSHASPRTSTCLSITSAELYNWDDDPSSMQRSRSKEFARQVSQRRKMRIRLKKKRNSHSQSQLRSAQSSFDDDGIPLVFQNLVATLEPPPNGTEQAPEPAQVELKSKDESPWPVIPKRLSSNLGPAPAQIVKRSVDLVRKVSITTIRSHHSHVSVVEPMNSTRMWATAPHISAPDMGPSLHSMSLNMNFAFPQAPTPPTQPRRKGPGLPMTQSFFSDDSSAAQNPRASLRKKLHLPDLRGKISMPHPSKSSLHLPLHNGVYETPKPARIPQRLRTNRDRPVQHPDTVGLSEFAYRKKKIVERVKGWWSRQCVQRRRVKKRLAEGETGSR